MLQTRLKVTAPRNLEDPTLSLPEVQARLLQETIPTTRPPFQAQKKDICRRVLLLLSLLSASPFSFSYWCSSFDAVRELVAMNKRIPGGSPGSEFPKRMATQKF